MELSEARHLFDGLVYRIASSASACHDGTVEFSSTIRASVELHYTLMEAGQIMKLIEAIGWLQRTGVIPAFVFTEPGFIDSMVKAAVQKVLQESVTNFIESL